MKTEFQLGLHISNPMFFPTLKVVILLVVSCKLMGFWKEIKARCNNRVLIHSKMAECLEEFAETLQ